MNREFGNKRLSESQVRKLKKRKKKNVVMRLLIIFILLIFLLLIAYISVKSILGLFKKEDVSTAKKETTISDDTDSQVNTKNNLFSEKIENSVISSQESEVINEKKGDTTESDSLITEIINPDKDLAFSKEEEERIVSILPESLVERIEKYPESKNTTLLYEKFLDFDSKNDIFDEIENSKRLDRKVKLPYLSQWDKRWGFKKVDDEFISYSGCGPVSLTMIYGGLTGDGSITPFEMASKMFELGLYSRDGGEYPLFTEGAKSLGLNGEDIGNSREALLEALNSGKIVVALVNHNGIGDFTFGGHYIVISEITDNGMLRIYDVNSYNNTNKLWDVDRIMEQARLFYSVWK